MTFANGNIFINQSGNMSGIFKYVLVDRPNVIVLCAGITAKPLPTLGKQQVRLVFRKTDRGERSLLFPRDLADFNS